METLWVLLFISVLFIYLNKVFGIADIIKKKLNPPPPPPPEPEYPYCKKNLLTESELEFFKNLKSLTDEYSLGINLKTCLDDIICIKDCDDKSQLDELFDKIKFKSIDFVIFDPENMLPECLIEFRDGSHKEPEQIEEDKFLKTLCEKNSIDFILYQGDFEKITKYFDENWEIQT